MTTVTASTIEEQQQADAMANDLRSLAAFIASNPEAMTSGGPFGYRLSLVFERMLVSVETRDQVAAYARAGLRAGAVITKHANDAWAGVDIGFGTVSLHVYAARDEVCERIVVGTHEVTEEVPDPEAAAALPKIKVTKTVEDVEWRCGSFLAAPEPAEVAEAALVAS